ncbi:MAG: hypothetical protein CM15mP74_08110 [Halieaceae bacterium]|nr:MAG: hypothetical protein CM15mP74_08110 [Halieaceae bacterium]
MAAFLLLLPLLIVSAFANDDAVSARPGDPGSASRQCGCDWGPNGLKLEPRELPVQIILSRCHVTLHRFNTICRLGHPLLGFRTRSAGASV